MPSDRRPCEDACLDNPFSRRSRRMTECAMTECDQHASCHRYARLRPSGTADATDPLSAIKPQDVAPLDSRTPNRSWHTCQHITRQEDISKHHRTVSAQAYAPPLTLPNRTDITRCRRHPENGHLNAFPKKREVPETHVELHLTEYEDQK